ncbi:hypothetical protein RND71_009453 [Anisodus tanguticus]|uniref:DUF3444 domain-containing protein n=1 Tax=Anisodus tanguticus TaxID=243964 RepID=A0AAE1SIG1_9SOLA|nr:hypothetical protein RND71_009453 [Anisodus tanguticus]
MGASNMPATCVIDFMLAYLEISAGLEEARTNPIKWAELRVIFGVQPAELHFKWILRDDIKKSSVFGTPVDIEPEVKSLTVPNPDFHNFDKDKTERSFDDNEVWAAYDDDDGMPRYYAMIHNVISKKSFKGQFSWLNSKTTLNSAQLIGLVLASSRPGEILGLASMKSITQISKKESGLWRSEGRSSQGFIESSAPDDFSHFNLHTQN